MMTCDPGPVPSPPGSPGPGGHAEALTRLLTGFSSHHPFNFRLHPLQRMRETQIPRFADRFDISSFDYSTGKVLEDQKR
jgi:hypothetical protein